MNKLFEIERKFKNLVEDKFVNIFSHSKHEDLISRKLASTMYDQARSLDNGVIQAPNFFLLMTSSEIAEELKDNKNFLKDLSYGLSALGREVGFSFLSRIIISIHEDKSYKKNNIKVIASYLQNTEDETRGIQLNRNKFRKGTEKGYSTYLIIEGKKALPLENQVVNLGRRPENTIVFDDPRISRDHAQIREINGRYKIFDLNSKGGTFLNDHPISQSFLKSGDVISLAGSPMIFIQDETEKTQLFEETLPNEL